jgi:tetratricopeptide (TPR) repeat protein
MANSLIVEAQGQLKAGNFAESIHLAHQALALAPGDTSVLDLIGRAWQHLGRPYEALQAFDAIVQLKPSRPDGYFGLAGVFKKIGSSFDAAEALARGIQIDPVPDRLIELAELEVALGRYEHAFDVAARALTKDPRNFSANLIAGRSLVAMRRIEEADKYFFAAKQNESLSWRVAGHKGYALSIAGLFDEAEASLSESLRLNPLQGAAYELIFAGRRATWADRKAITKMEQLEEQGVLEDEELAPLLFALGKAWDDLEDPRRAMRFYDRGNLVRSRERGIQRPFRPDMEAKRWQTVRDLYPDKFSLTSGPCTAMPIFIVGLMRSGTTLVEQILARHPQVVPAGELDFWSGSEAIVIDQNANRIRPGSVGERRSAYLRLISSFGGLQDRVVDKYHANLSIAGIIHAAFPDSAIIHMHRNPVDTALSMWMTDSSSPFLWNREHIVSWIRMATEQAEYWRERIPSNRFLDVKYEDLVGDPFAWSSRIAEFCGLSQADGGQPNKAAPSNIRTVSVWQARQPVYKTSVERWKRYEPWLGAFQELFALQPNQNHP